MHPVPQSLTIHAAGLGRQLAIRPVEHHGKSQHTPGRRAVLLPPSRRSKFGRRQIKPVMPTAAPIGLLHAREQASSQNFADFGNLKMSQTQRPLVLERRVRRLYNCNLRSTG